MVWNRWGGGTPLRGKEWFRERAKISTPPCFCAHGFHHEQGAHVTTMWGPRKVAAMTTRTSEVLPNVRQAHDLIRALFDKADRARKPRLDSPRERAVFFLTAKAFRTQRAMMALAHEGLGQDAMTLLRSLYECMITLYYLVEKATQEEINMYGAFVDISKGKRLDAILKYFPRSLSTERLRQAERAIRERAASAREYFFGEENARRWWEDFSKMATALDLEGVHRVAYKHFTDYAHPGAIVAEQYVTEGEERISPRIDEPDYDITNAALGTAAGFLREVLGAFNKTFQCGIDEKDLQEIHQLLVKKELLGALTKHAEQLRKRHVERLRNTLDVHGGDVLLTPLHRTDVRAVNLRAEAQRFL